MKAYAALLIWSIPIFLLMRWGSQMGGWGFWDWVAYGALWLTAIIEGLELGLARAREIRRRLPSFLFSRNWAFVPVALLTLSTGIFVIEQLSGRTPAAARGAIVPIIPESQRAALPYRDAQFRIDARKLILNDFAEVRENYKDLVNLMGVEYRKKLAPQANLSAMSMMDELAGSFYDSYFSLAKYADQPIENYDQDQLQTNLSAFLLKYQASQQYISQYSIVSGVNPRSELEQYTKKLFDADERAFRAFRDLKTSPSATIIKRVDDNVMMAKNGGF